MTDHERTINRADSTRTNSGDADGEDEDRESKSEEEIRRELRSSPIGEALLARDRHLRGRFNR